MLSVQSCVVKETHVEISPTTLASANDHGKYEL